MAEWVLRADLDLRPFYRKASKDPLFKTVVGRLQGVKPMRPVSLFEMVIIAITEQQISLAVAQKIRARLVERFGEIIDGLRLFPTPAILATASQAELRACGLSQRKAEYIIDVSGQVADGTLDLENLKRLSDDDVRTVITRIRGFGRWSADYILSRGLGRPDIVPADDLGIQTIAGKYLGDGDRLTANQVIEVFNPYAPFRGLAMFYLLAYHRLKTVSEG
jgi:DNA-3-methyladenine glycosylase II